MVHEESPRRISGNLLPGVVLVVEEDPSVSIVIKSVALVNRPLDSPLRHELIFSIEQVAFPMERLNGKTVVSRP